MAHYHESPGEMAAFIASVLEVPFIRAMQLHIHIFSKAANQAAFDPSVLSPWNYTWTALKGNVGKESESYLQYIVQHYHSLPDYTLFCQAHPHSEGIQPGLLPLHIAVERLSSFSRSVDMMGLGLVINCACTGCYGFTEDFPLFGQLYAVSAKRLCPKGASFTVFLQGQFIVRRQGIHRHQLSFYSHLLELFRAPPGHWIHYDDAGGVLQVFDGDHSEALELTNAMPQLGHVLERLWAPMFGCHHPLPPTFETCVIEVP